MSAPDRSHWWCWSPDDPEMTFGDPGDWLDDVNAYNEAPEIQRFDWGQPAPSTWVVYWYDDDGRDWKQFETEQGAKEYAAQVAAKARGEQ